MSSRSNENRPASECRKETAPRGAPTARSLKILELREQGLSRKEIGQRMGMSIHSVSRALTEARAAGGLS